MTSIREPLSADRIVEAALARIDAHGLSSLSMRKLGADLGVEGMALYRHVPDKHTLVALVVERAYAEMTLPDPASGWRDRLRHSARELRRVALAHPHLLAALVVDPPPLPEVRRRIDAVLAALREATGDDASAVRHFWVVTAFMSGALLSETAVLRPPPAGQSAESLDGPLVCPALDALGPALATCDFEAQYAFGLDTMLAAVPPRA